VINAIKIQLRQGGICPILFHGAQCRCAKDRSSAVMTGTAKWNFLNHIGSLCQGLSVSQKLAAEHRICV
jgi:hypothetical protein